MKKAYNLRDHQYAQCKAIVDDVAKTIDFVSYVTRVISVRFNAEGKREIECTGTYSQTTRKQIGWFLREYVPGVTYQQVKAIVGQGFVAL